MGVLSGLLIIALGAFCQSSSYVPINKIKKWSWESYWLVQGVFAWLVFPLLGALLAIPDGHGLLEVYMAYPKESILTMVSGIFWGIGGLTFGLSMRYLGVALGQSISLGTCAALGTIMGPFLINLFFPELDALSSLTSAVLIGVAVTLIGIAVIGIAGGMKSASLSEDDKKSAVKDFNFPKGLAIALLAGFMSGCFNVGLEFGKELNFAELTHPMFRTLPATFLVTIGGFLTNAAYCLYQNKKNNTFSDYRETKILSGNILFCALAGLLWYSQFFGLSLGRSFFEAGSAMDTLAFCILMALNVTFSNVWGIILKEWKGCSGKTIIVLIAGIAILIVSSFLPEFLK